MALKFGEITEIAAGSSLEMKNNVWDCPSFFVDGISGVSVTAHVVKIHFLQQLPIEQDVNGKFAVSLVIPLDQIEGFAAVFNRVVEVIAPAPETK